MKNTCVVKHLKTIKSYLSIPKADVLKGKARGISDTNRLYNSKYWNLNYFFQQESSAYDSRNRRSKWNQLGAGAGSPRSMGPHIFTCDQGN